MITYSLIDQEDKSDSDEESESDSSSGTKVNPNKGNQRLFTRRNVPRIKKRGIPHRIANKNIEIRVELSPEDLRKLIRHR